MTPEEQLLQNIKNCLPELKVLHEELIGEWYAEDGFYRYYHRSFKVYYLQDRTSKIVDVLKSMNPTDGPLNAMFLDVIEQGTGKKFSFSVNRNWSAETLPILQAFSHARMMLEMAIKYGEELKAVRNVLPTGWGLFLYLYGLR